MSRPLPKQPPTGLTPPPSTQELAYAELLCADSRARARGQPLLTDAGVVYLRRRLSGALRGCTTRTLARSTPRWDRWSRQLWMGNTLVKEFRQPAPHQTRLLDAFQAARWRRSRLADPLPKEDGEGEEDARQRLHETIKNLNRGLLPGTLRFHGDGTGRGVIWEYDEG